MSNLYEKEYGLRTVINCIGSMTSLGGSRMQPKAVAAMQEASQHFVDLNKLLLAAGEKAARLCKVEHLGYSAHITTGAATSIVLASAAAMTGCDVDKIALLPDTSSFARREIILDGGSDMRWNRCVQLTGAKLRVIGTQAAPMTAAQLRAALDNRGGDCKVAGVLYFAVNDDEGEKSGLALRDVIDIAHAGGVPCFVDGAAQLPPVSNLRKYAGMGADAVFFR
jgi:L-seryl-tRNA(Ser) seleniumtransferase